MELSLLDNFENNIVFEIVHNHKDDILKFIHVLDYINSRGLTIGTFDEKTKITDYISANFSNVLNEINLIIQFSKEIKSKKTLTTGSLSNKINIQNNFSFDKILIIPIKINSIIIGQVILGISAENDTELFYKTLNNNIECLKNTIINSVNFSYFQKRNQFYNISLDLLFVTNLRGEIVDLNPQVENFLGIPKNEIINNSILKYLHSDDISKTIQALTELKKIKVIKGFSTKVLTHNKTYKNIHWNAISDDQYMYVVGKDLTDDENVKNQLNKVYTILKQAEKVTKMGAWELDVATGLTFWTDEVYAIHELEKGFDHNKVNGIEFYHPDYRKVISNAIENSIVNQVQFDVTCKFIGAKGTLKWVRSSGIPLVESNNVTKIFGVFIDVTEEENNKIVAELEKFKLDAIIQGTNVGTWEWNIKTGQSVFNEKWAEIIGYTLDELQPISINTWMQFAHPEDLNRTNILLQEHFEGKTDFYSCESRMLHKNGNWIWVLDRGKVVSWTEDGKPLMMYGTHQDITIQKELELNLTNQNLLINQFFDLSPIGLAVNEFNGGKFLQINSALLNIVGYTKEDFLNLSYFDLTPEKYYSEEIEMIESLKKTGVYGPFEKEYIHKNGNLIPVLLKGVLVKDENEGDKIWSVIEDISERKKIEKTQLWNFNFQKLIAKHSSIFVKTNELNFNKNVSDFLKEFGEFFNVDRAYIFTSEDNLTTVSNEFEWCANGIDAEMQNLLNVPMKEFKFLKTNLEKFGFAHLPNLEILEESEEKSEYERQKIQSLVCAEISIQDKKIGFFGFDAVKSKKEWSVFEIHSLKLLSNTIADLFLKRTRERLLIENQLKLENALKIKDEFLTNISHEIRTPLNAIMGFGEILEKTNLSNEQTKVVEIISLASKKLMNILNDVLDVAKFNDGIVELDVKTINLHQLTKEIILLQGVKAREKNIEIQYIIDENVPELIIGDETRLNQILINLTNNAIKFTENGWVKVEVKEVQRDNLKTTIQFKIRDTGIGIPIEKQIVIFDRFVQAEASTNRKYGGTGLGLSIVKSLVELYQGKISLNSDGKNGTEFIVEITFQISEEKSYVNIEKEIEKDTSILLNKKVLLVEDNDFNQILAKNILQQFKMHVDIAEDGFVALDFIQKKSYDIILMDLQMPNLDGYSTSKIMINDLGIKTPIIACSAHVQKKEKEECEKIGITDYLSKPYTKFDLINILCNHLHPNNGDFNFDDNHLQDIKNGVDKVKMENGIELFKILSNLYLQRIPEDLNRINMYLSEKNWEELKIICHKLIGSFGTLNFNEASKICKKIENDLKSNTYINLNKDIEYLSTYIQNSLKYLNS
jgi:PAS domain S-box-containing protein